MKQIILILFLLILVSCGQSTKKETALSQNDKQLCDSLEIDVSVIEELRKHTDAEVEAFHYSLSRQINPDGTEIELDPIRLPGLVFSESQENTGQLIGALQDNFRVKGYTLFVVDENFGIENKPDVMAILKSTDKYEILRQIKTDGINYDIDTDSLINLVKVFDAKYSLSLVGASGDWCEFIVQKEPADWMVFANEAYAVCPDIVDQGTGSVEALAEEMRNTKRLYFWWD